MKDNVEGSAHQSQELRAAFATGQHTGSSTAGARRSVLRSRQPPQALQHRGIFSAFTTSHR